MTRVLVVDDDRLVCWSLGRALAREGYEVMTLESAEQALAEVGTSRFGLVITDFALPGMDGLELLEQMRSMCPDIRAIVITGKGSREVEREALNRGATAYVEKPFSVRELVGLVKTILPTLGTA
ncbi:MAG: response regulator, partial [Candidatus Methylomirabilales bacterium]